MLEDGVWRTIGGRRVFIKKGQSLSGAMKESGKFNLKNKKPKEAKPTKTEKKEATYEELENIAENKALNDDYSKSTDRIKDMAKNYYKELGYDAKPVAVDEEEYNKLKSKGYKEIHRGIRGYGEEGKTGKDFVKQYNEGDLYIGDQRVFGSGTYYTYEKDASSTVERYSNKDGATVSNLLSKDAKVITSSKLNELKAKYSKQAVDKAMEISKTDMNKASKYYDKMNKIINTDNGIFAASLGYDAIDVEDANYIVSLNRGKIIRKK